MAVGTTAFGKYQLFATLGRGGMADVFLSVSRGPMGFQKLVVVKRLRIALAEDPVFRAMFLDEARLAARLNHPNVVHTYEVGEHDGAYFIAMEYLEGQPLNAILRAARNADKPLGPELSVRLMCDALAGLHHAHELKDYDGTPLAIVHRDISPHNLFVSYDGGVKLMDFGIAKGALSSTQTETGILKGKAAYMAPEQALGVNVDRRADLFSAGIVLWELLAGQRMLPGDSMTETLVKLLSKPIPRLKDVAPQIDPVLEQIVMRALEREPNARWSTATEMREALEGWLNASGHTVRSESLGRRVSDLFVGIRIEIQQQIKAHMGAATIDDASSVVATAPALADPSSSLRTLPSIGVGSYPSMQSGSGSGGSAALAGSSTIDPPIDGVTPAASRKKQRKLLAGMLGAGALAAVCGWWLARVDVDRRVAQRANAAVDQGPPSLPPVVSAAPPPIDPPAAAPPAAAPPADPTAVADARTAAPNGRSPRAVSFTPRPPPRPPRTGNPPSTVSANDDPGFLTLDTYPWTKVSEGGRALGTTPIAHVTLTPGEHVLVLENAEQGIRQSYVVTVKSGESVTKRLGLK